MSSVLVIDAGAWLAAGERLRAADPIKFAIVYEDIQALAQMREDERRLNLERGARELARGRRRDA